MQGRSEGVWKSMRAAAAGIAWFLSDIAVRAVVESPERFPRSILIAIVLVPVIPAALFLYFFITDMRREDELQRRIQLEALALAYPLVLLLLLTLGSLDRVIDLDPENWSYRHLGPFVILFYVIGLWVSTRRYR